MLEVRLAIRRRHRLEQRREQIGGNAISRPSIKIRLRHTVGGDAHTFVNLRFIRIGQAIISGRTPTQVTVKTVKTPFWQFWQFIGYRVLAVFRLEAGKVPAYASPLGLTR